MSNTEGHVLTYLLSYAPCPISELHRVFGLKRSTLTSMLDRMESRDFLCRKPHARDRRSLMVYLIPKGRNLGQKIRKLLEGFERQVLAMVKSGQLKGFHLVMEAIEKVSDVKVRMPSKEACTLLGVEWHVVDKAIAHTPIYGGAPALLL